MQVRGTLQDLNSGFQLTSERCRGHQAGLVHLPSQSSSRLFPGTLAWPGSTFGLESLHSRCGYGPSALMRKKIVSYICTLRTCSGFEQRGSRFILRRGGSGPVIIGTSRESRRKADATATPERCPLTGLALGAGVLRLLTVNRRPLFPSQSSLLVLCLPAYEPMPEACPVHRTQKPHLTPL